MKNKLNLQDAKQTVAIIAPFPPPLGGMALQAQKLYKKLIQSGINSFYIKTNVSFPRFLSLLEKFRGVRTLIRFIIFLYNLLSLRRATVIQIFGASHSYFFLVVAPSILMANLMKKKVILNYRGGEAETFLKRWGLLAIPLLRKVDVVAVPSDFLKEFFKKIVGREVAILPNLIDVEIFRFKERTKLKPFIVVSRQLEPRYNIACALKAFKIIKNAFPGAQLKIAGSGSDEERLKQLREELLLKDAYFLGELSHKELSHVYDECDIMINTSNVDNFPGSILEAFACGLPVVTTSVGGIPFMVNGGETGIMVDPDDHEGIANNVIRLLRNPELAQKFSLNGRKVAAEHSWEKVKKVIFSMYELV